MRNLCRKKIMANKKEQARCENVVDEATAKILDKHTKKAMKRWRENYDEMDYMKSSIKKIIEHRFVNGYLSGMADASRTEPIKKIVDEFDKYGLITRKE